MAGLNAEMLNMCNKILRSIMEHQDLFFFNNIFIVSKYSSQSKGNVKEVTASTHECVLALCGFPGIRHKVVTTTVCYKNVLVSPCIQKLCFC